jgi:hypothetical protein
MRGRWQWSRKPDGCFDTYTGRNSGGLLVCCWCCAVLGEVGVTVTPPHCRGTGASHPAPTHLHVGITGQGCRRRGHQLLQAVAGVTPLWQRLRLLLGPLQGCLYRIRKALHGGGGRGWLVQRICVVCHLCQQWQATRAVRGCWCCCLTHGGAKAANILDTGQGTWDMCMQM